MSSFFKSLPRAGRPRQEVLAQMEAARAQDVAWQDGRVFSLVFATDDAELSALLKEAYTLFFSENGLNPTAFPSLRRFETDVIGMSLGLLHGEETAVGNMTSGGTESIMLAVLAAREWAAVHKPAIPRPQIVLASTAHPAFDKAAHYFNLDVCHVPVGANFRADPAAMAAAITPRTALIVGSAPAYPHGVVDPIPALAALAQQHGILCHVDACVGGFMLPFVRQLGYDVPPFDFAVPGVTSMSADLHKYGYAAKGASLILYRDRALRRHQMFAAVNWPGGVYASPTLAGTRPGGAIAAAWAAMVYLGEAGYRRIAKGVMETAVALRAGIHQIDGLHILGEPHMSVMAIGADDLDVYAVGDEMAARGWHLDRQQFPPSLHLTVNGAHVGQEAALLADLRAAVAQVRRSRWRQWRTQALVRAAQTAARVLPAPWVQRMTGQASKLFGGDAGLPQRSAAMYGMIGTLPNRGDLQELVLDLVEQFTEPQEKTAAS